VKLESHHFKAMADNPEAQQSQDRYIYEPLPMVPNEVHIRLLLLQPGTGDETISGKLIHNVSPRSEDNDFAKPSLYYEALSYVWGPPPESREILVDGKRFAIRENLWMALNHLRKKDKEVTLWTDAICINQDDLLEKNAQVAQMNLVYLGAKKVLIWLGEDKENISTIITSGYQNCIGIYNRAVLGRKCYQVGLYSKHSRQYFCGRR
jgi:hypothetical protein